MERHQVDPPTAEEAALVENRTLISLLFPAQNGELVKQLEGQGATVMAMDCIPRTLSRGQTYDALSSQVCIGLIDIGRQGFFVVVCSLFGWATKNRAFCFSGK